MSERPLWAPWRIEYITGPKNEECIFCQPDPAHLVQSGERCSALLNSFPYAPGHVMVAPTRHVGELTELDDDELQELMQLARRMVEALKVAMSPNGFNLGLNLGQAAGAGIADHLHLHVVPRWEGDNNFMAVMADTHVIPQALEETRKVLVKALEESAGR